MPKKRLPNELVDQCQNEYCNHICHFFLKYRYYLQKPLH